MANPTCMLCRHLFSAQTPEDPVSDQSGSARSGSAANACHGLLDLFVRCSRRPTMPVFRPREPKPPQEHT